jgi:flagellar hook protein FlgE
VSKLTTQAGTPTAINGTGRATVLTKSLEASNASMTQSVPELSLAQKLFSALTKVLQTVYTNQDNVLNLIR